METTGNNFDCFSNQLVRTAVMKTLHLIVGVLVTIVVANPVQASDILVQPAPNVRALKVVNTAFEACVHRFVARLFPKQEIKANTHFAVDARTAEQLLAQYNEFFIKLQAESKRDGSQLALGLCSVSRDARVTSFAMRMNDQAKVAAMTSGDIHLSMINR